MTDRCPLLKALQQIATGRISGGGPLAGHDAQEIARRVLTAVEADWPGAAEMRRRQASEVS